MQTGIDDKRDKSLTFAPVSDVGSDLKFCVQENSLEEKSVKLSKEFSSDEKKTNDCVSSHFLKPKNVQPAKSISIHTIKQVDDDNSLSFLWQDAKWFLRYTKLEAESVSMEVKTAREIESKKKRWFHLKQAFQERLELLALKREKNQ